MNVKRNSPRRKSRRRKPNPMKGWKSPSTRDRESMLVRCGKKCFLIPEKMKFPVCNQDCRYSCKGLLAAKVRARQWKYEDVAKKAQNKSVKNKCKWVKSTSRRRKSTSRRRKSTSRRGKSTYRRRKSTSRRKY